MDDSIFGARGPKNWTAFSFQVQLLGQVWTVSFRKHSPMLYHTCWPQCLPFQKKIKPNSCAIMAQELLEVNVSISINNPEKHWCEISSFLSQCQLVSLTLQHQWFQQKHIGLHGVKDLRLTTQPESGSKPSRLCLVLSSLVEGLQEPETSHQSVLQALALRVKYYQYLAANFT